MVRTRSVGLDGNCNSGDVDWAKFLYDDVRELVTEEVSVIPKNIVSERRKRLEGLLSSKNDATTTVEEKEQETCVDLDRGDMKTLNTKCTTVSTFLF
jgi:hypothetical protein